MKLIQRVRYFFSRNISSGVLHNAVKFSLFASIFPIMAASFYMYFIRNVVSLEEYIILLIIIFLAIAISVIPLFKDYNALSGYLGALSFNRPVKFPNLGSSKALADLIESIKVMSKSWEQTKTDLNHKIIESKLLFDTIPDIILVVNSDFIIIKSNEQISDIYKKNPVGESILDVIKNPLLEGCIRWVFHDKVGKQLEISVDLKDTQNFYFAKVEYYQLDDESKDFAVVVLQDITEIKRTEKMFSDFISNASHEIKTPLASIIGVVETLQHTGHDDPEAVKEFMPILQSQALRMSALIGDLLSLAKIEKMQNSPPDEEIEFASIVNVAIESLKWNIKKGKNNIVLKGESNLPKIIGDKFQLIQVMENLISNAIKYGGDEKDIIIEFGTTNHIPKNNVFIGDVKKALFVSVTDKGEGIPKKYLPRLTERFFRIDKSRSSKIGGTGLGLAIVKQILNRHEAILDIKSKIGAGTTFTVLFALK
jgi:two-component system, OmpR family, phosphate regulon sensor histidine kinase PhoR